MRSGAFVRLRGLWQALRPSAPVLTLGYATHMTVSG